MVGDLETATIVTNTAQYPRKFQEAPALVDRKAMPGMLAGELIQCGAVAKGQVTAMGEPLDPVAPLIGAGQKM